MQSHQLPPQPWSCSVPGPSVRGSRWSLAWNAPRPPQSRPAARCREQLTLPWSFPEIIKHYTLSLSLSLRSASTFKHSGCLEYFIQMCYVGNNHHLSSVQPPSLPPTQWLVHNGERYLRLEHHYKDWILVFRIFLGQTGWIFSAWGLTY